MTKESKATGIKSWPEDDRPREKLLKKGAGALSSADRWCKYRDMILGILKGLSDLE